MESPSGKESPVPQSPVPQKNAEWSQPMVPVAPSRESRPGEARPRSAPMTRKETHDVNKEKTQAELEKKLQQQQEEIKMIKEQLAKLQQNSAKESNGSGDVNADSRAKRVSSARMIRSPRRQPQQRPTWSRPLAETFACKQHFTRPTPQAVESSSISKVDQQLILFGGTNGAKIFDTVWTYNTVANEWRRPTTGGDPPMGRYGHSMVTYKKGVVIYGGYGFGGISANPKHGGASASSMVGYGKQWVDTEQGYEPMSCGLLASMYALDANTMLWQRIPHQESAQDFTKNHSSVVHGHHMYVFGGCLVQGRSNVVKVFDLESYAWLAKDPYNPQLLAYALGTSDDSILATIPCPRSGHTAVINKDTSGNPWMVIFGGRASKTRYCDDTFAYSIQSKTWHRLETTGHIPAPRAGHSAIIYKTNMVIFGGYAYKDKDTKIYYNDIHILDLMTLIWRKAKVGGHIMPCARCSHVSAAYETPEKTIRMLVFGGWGEVTRPDQDFNAHAAKEPTLYAANADTFVFNIAVPIQKQRTALPCIRTARPMELNPEDMDDHTMGTWGGNSSTKKKSSPRPFTVPSAKKVPTVPESPKQPTFSRLSKKQIEEAVNRLSDTEGLMLAKENLEKKYIQEMDPRRLTYEQMEGSVERLYYDELAKKRQLLDDLENKWLKKEAPRILDEDQLLEMVERLTTIHPTKEDAGQRRRILSPAAVKELVTRLYTEELENREAKRKELQNKYF